MANHCECKLTSHRWIEQPFDVWVSTPTLNIVVMFVFGFEMEPLCYEITGKQQLMESRWCHSRCAPFWSSKTRSDSRNVYSFQMNSKGSAIQKEGNKHLKRTLCNEHTEDLLKIFQSTLFQYTRPYTEPGVRVIYPAIIMTNINNWQNCTELVCEISHSTNISIWAYVFLSVAMGLSVPLNWSVRLPDKVVHSMKHFIWITNSQTLLNSKDEILF